MTVNSGPTPRPDTYHDAEEALAADVRRLGQFHRIEGWGLLGNGTQYLLCSCTRVARTDKAFWKHILEALARERGPVPKPKR